MLVSILVVHAMAFPDRELVVLPSAGVSFVVTWVLLFVISLPSMVLAWIEPDPPPDDA